MISSPGTAMTRQEPQFLWQDGYESSLMPTVSLSRLSIVYHILWLCVPFFILYFLLRISKLYLILPFVFGKAYIYFFCKFSFRLAYGTAGWLVSELVFFSDSILMCVLLFFWNLPDIKGRKLDRLAAICLIVLFLVGIIDYCAVSPFVETLLNY